ncbi:hypothetical protein [Haloarcula nitratireducens]|uniref:hypothetical protein n=1 Tax=Haloarcula nitratireducens TaxID=2487749 RepID=UPI001F248FA7|nr:hypothetical protein [Halomicroarcula nitratireducens]
MCAVIFVLSLMAVGALVVSPVAVLIGYVVSVLCFRVRVPALDRLGVTALLVI